ncbi:putative Ig domain-containing protein [Pararhizobium sp. BT-229]|uniref:putative Ig domain-containing protein n=1 Tax=Pararhizobium sp. BT-229 TaxID=2986923 RepID=UPI0021F71D98|nr:putative Ig domain-containing protein [Pararhizobium sp. BT-229]MCV9964599.1 putative Ig domain-containing protein [Pararhizobium sp. BT-229]
MPRKHISVLLSLSIAANIAAPAAGHASSETYFFRYKTALKEAQQPSEGQAKDIVAFFVGGVGIAFDEKLPMKPEWEDDNWVVKGTLPTGISFDPATRSFKGTPAAAVTATKVELEGFDRTGASVATASATFDIYSIQGSPFSVDLYAHTGKYKLDQLPLPEKTIETWTRVYAPPGGIEIIGRNLDGIPTKAGVYPVFLQGKDYLGNVVATYFGKYTVEDGPSFPFIADAVSKLPQLEYTSGLGPYNFGAPSTYPVNRAINPAKKVRYFAEIKQGDALPYGVVLDDNPFDVRFKGLITRPYDTVTVRFKAIDSDDTVGHSNWFTFGSSDPQPGCYPYPVGTLTTYTGVQSEIGIPRPFGAHGDLKYDLASGTLPQGLELEAATGLIKGIPVKAEPPRNITVDVSVINESGTARTSCAYSIESRNGSLSVADTTPGQDRHVRVGATYSGVATISGGIPDWTTAFADAHDGLSIVGDTTNSTTVKVAGALATKGLPHAVGLTVANGDGNSQSGQLAIYAHEPLAFGDAPDLQAKRLAASTVIGSVPYDGETVINDYSGAVNYPIITLDHPERLPAGIGFDGRSFVGTTSAPAGNYGPFKATMQDFTGETVESGEFSLTVAARDEIAIASVTGPTFAIRHARDVSKTPAVVKQPPGADGLAITWAVAGTLPDWLSFNPDSGAFTARADLPFSLKGTYGPFTVTATDSEGSTATSTPFDVTVTDLAAPALSTAVPLTRGNVSGDQSSGENVTFVQTPAIRNLILADTVVGGQAGVTFTSHDPEYPAGLVFNPADGSFSGEPVSEFNGDIAVSFEDQDGRTGTATVPLQVKPYPKVAMEQGAYDLQRLADADWIKGTELSGFWGASVWSIDRGTLPEGVTVGASGVLAGNTTAAEGTVSQDIVLRARDSSTGLTARTQPFSITVKAKGAYSVTYGGTSTFFLTDKTITTPYAVASHTAAIPTVSGAARTPLSYSIVSSDKDLPDGLTVNPVTGVASFAGTPELGRWNLKIAAKDSDGQAATDQADLSIWSTLAGNINQPSSDNAPGTGSANGLGSGNAYVLRVGEPFQILPIKATNTVGDVTFSTSPAALYPGLDFSGATGAFSDASHFENPGNYAIAVGATDTDGRTMPVLDFSFQVVPPLDLKASQTVFQGKQFDHNSVDARFQAATNGLGSVSYTVAGDAPGTLTYAVHDDNGVLTSYQWTDKDGRFHDLTVDATGKVTGHKEEGAPQPVLSEAVSDYFALDALVFDGKNLTLKGTPSQSGTFALKLIAIDDHTDRYIKDVSSRTDNNRAEVAFTIVSAAAEPLSIATATKDGAGIAETINLFTSQATMVTTVSNAAYGKPVTWTKIAGTLPDGLSARQGPTTLGYSGYPDATGTYSDIRWRAKDAAGRMIDSSATTLTVGPRLPLALAASSNPRGLVVNTTDADLTVTAKNTAYGSPIETTKWSVSGQLPPGVTFKANDGKLHFEGIPTLIGTWSGIAVTGTDSKGASASINLTITVISPTDAIVLSVPNLSTKAGYPFSIQASASNTYGAVRFYSNDITTKYAQELSIAGTTGLISGSFATTQQANFDVYVTDETNRVTSRPVVVDVVPVLRIAVPTLVSLTQGSNVTQSVDTFNKLGTVTFEKVGSWPQGVTLNPSTGAIGITNAATGTYAGLQIRGTDTFSGTQTDVQLSNAFSLKVDPIDALPVIASPTDNKLPAGTVGTAFPAYTAAVTDNVSGKPWPGPLTFNLNHDIAADTGLTFDAATGTISGTPTKPVIYKDLVITATSERGDKASTQPFWFGVKPSGDITPDLSQQTHFVLRMDTDFSIGPFKFLNTYGTLTYSGTPTATDPNTGILGGKAPLPAGWYTGPNGKWTGNYVTVTDEFGRKGTIEYSVTDVYGLTITPPGGLTFGAGEATTTSAAPAVANVYGTASFTAQGLPSWLTLNANGSVTGAAPSGTATGTYPISVTVKDSYDGVSKTVTYNVKVTDIKAYKVVFDTWHPHPTLPTCVGLSEFMVFNGATNITSLANAIPSAAAPAYPAQNLTDGVVSTASMWFITEAASEKSITFRNVPGNKPTSIQWVHRADGYTPCNPTSWHIMTTSDNQTWETVLSASGAGTGLVPVITALP